MKDADPQFKHISLANADSIEDKIRLLFRTSKSIALPQESDVEFKDVSSDELIDDIDNLSKLIYEDLEFSRFAFIHAEVWSVFALARGLVNSYAHTGRKYLPRFFVSTMFKSGTKHLETILRKSYLLSSSQLLTGAAVGKGVHVSPKVDIYSSFFWGRSFVSSHFHCCDTNLAFIEQLSLPVIVLIRNPAQASLSAYHYLSRISTDDSVEIKSLLSSPGLLYDETKSVNSLKELQAFIFTTHFLRQVDFVDSWLWFFAKSSHQRKLLLFQEHLSECPEYFYSSIVQFMNIPSRGFSEAILGNHSDNPNFRKGLTDEWKTAIPSQYIPLIVREVRRLKAKYPLLEDVWKL